MERAGGIRVSIFVALFMLMGSAPVAAETVCRVIDDYGNPVECVVVRVTAGDEKVPFAETDQNGRFSITEQLCANNPVFRVEPKGENHFRSQVYACEAAIKNPTFTILVTNKNILANLSWNAKYFEEQNACATAAMIYNDIYQRARAFDEVLAEEAKRKVIALFARHLGNNTPTVYDPLQKKDVIGPSFQQDIKNFQRVSAIPETGNIDMRTLRKAAATSVGRYMFTRVKD